MRSTFFSLFLVFATSIWNPADAETARVHFINVGKGDSTLIEFPCAAMLIDVGGVNNSKPLLSYLEKFFARRKDLNNTLALVVLTHGHRDHVQHFVEVASRYKILNVLHNDNHGQWQGPALEWLNAHPEVHQYTPEALEIPEPGITNATIDPIACPSINPSIKVFWGDVDHKPPGWKPKRFHDWNNHSVVTRIDFGEGSMLFTGDLTFVAIEEMLKHHNPADFDVDLFKISHHGFPNGTTPEFVEAVSPEIAVLSRPAVAPWTLRDFELYSRLMDRTRQPLTIPVYVQTGKRSDWRNAGSKKESNAKKIAARKMFQRTLNKAVYWTGIDGTIVVDVSDKGLLTVEPLQDKPMPPPSQLPVQSDLNLEGD